MKTAPTILLLLLTLGAAEPAVAAKPAPKGITSADDVEAATLRYFALLDKGEYAAAFAQIGSRAAVASFAEWRDGQAARRADSGPLRDLRVVKLTRYENPPGASEPGLYVAADYVGRFGKRGLLCGYLMWHRDADGRFRIARQDDGLLSDAQADKMTPEQLRQLWSQLACRDD